MGVPLADIVEGATLAGHVAGEAERLLVTHIQGTLYDLRSLLGVEAPR